MAGPTARETVHATDAVAGELEELQLTLGQEPCVDAYTDGGPVLAVDLRARDYLPRWPAFPPAAGRGGPRRGRTAAALRARPTRRPHAMTGWHRGDPHHGSDTGPAGSDHPMERVSTDE